ncbi:MAG: hypothetical protein AAF830_02095 [Pseudomonadota bacterium]
MREAWRKYLAVDVPSYTSYPVSAGFAATADGGTLAYAEVLKAIDPYQLVALYLNVPEAIAGASALRTAVDDLIEEIGIVARVLDGRGVLSAVHLRGAMASQLRGHDVQRLLSAVEVQLGLRESTPVAMDLDPTTSNAIQAAHFVKQGIRRFSVNIEPRACGGPSLHEKDQRVADCVADLRAQGASEVTLVVQCDGREASLCDIGELARDVLEIAPERIALAPDAMSLPGPGGLAAHASRSSIQFALVERAAAIFELGGYVRIGTDHFAKPGSALAVAHEMGRLRRGPIGFTDDAAVTILGLGVGGQSEVGETIISNTSDLAMYQAAVRCGVLPVAGITHLSARQKALGVWIKDLLCHRRASLAEYLAIITKDGGVSSTFSLDDNLRPLLKDGLAVIDKSEIIIPTEAAPFARLVAAAFDPEAPPKPPSAA